MWYVIAAGIPGWRSEATQFSTGYPSKTAFRRSLPTVFISHLAEGQAEIKICSQQQPMSRRTASLRCCPSSMSCWYAGRRPSFKLTIALWTQILSNKIKSNMYAREEGEPADAGIGMNLNDQPMSEVND